MRDIVLIGSDQVESASHRMSRAATQFAGVVDNLDAVLRAHQQFLDEWLVRFETAVASLRIEQAAGLDPGTEAP